MSLTPNFELTPLNSQFIASPQNMAHLYCCGPYFNANPASRSSFYSQQSNDELFFRSTNAADPTLDFTNWVTCFRNPHVRLEYFLTYYGDNKVLALIFGFDAYTRSHILVYSQYEQLADIPLEVGDNQFLMEIESLFYMNLYFIHTRHDGSNYGGSWYFRGITGYVV